MKPLKIIAKLFDGRIATTDGYLPFDSILAAAWMKRNYPKKYYNSDPTIDEMITPDLPLKKLDGDIYAASFAQYLQMGEEIAYWHKRLDVSDVERYVDFSGKRGKVDVKSGHYKAYRMPLNVILTPEVVWYAVGKRAEIESLLEEITALGKKTSQGFGQVTEWCVEEIEQDWSVWKGGLLMRNLPDPDGDAEWGVKPPYWYPANIVRCRMP